MCALYIGTAFARAKAQDSWEMGKTFPHMGQAWNWQSLLPSSCRPPPSQRLPCAHLINTEALGLLRQSTQPPRCQLFSHMFPCVCLSHASMCLSVTCFCVSVCHMLPCVCLSVCHMLPCVCLSHASMCLSVTCFCVSVCHMLPCVCLSVTCFHVSVTCFRVSICHMLPCVCLSHASMCLSVTCFCVSVCHMLPCVCLSHASMCLSHASLCLSVTCFLVSVTCFLVSVVCSLAWHPSQVSRSKPGWPRQTSLHWKSSVSWLNMPSVAFPLTRAGLCTHSPGCWCVFRKVLFPATFRIPQSTLACHVFSH
jgi:hypothetical protein